MAGAGGGGRLPAKFQETKSDSPRRKYLSNNEEGFKPGGVGILIPDRYRPRVAGVSGERYM